MADGSLEYCLPKGFFCRLSCKYRFSKTCETTCNTESISELHFCNLHSFSAFLRLFYHSVATFFSFDYFLIIDFIKWFCNSSSLHLCACFWCKHKETVNFELKNKKLVFVQQHNCSQCFQYPTLCRSPQLYSQFRD